MHPTKTSNKSGAPGIARTKLNEVVGCLRSKRKPSTVADMENAIKREIIRRHGLGRY